ncbi:MAG: hypothetical protein A3D34_01995 [Candidatus Staskawiczbacteria bacterium RIFCSPHIGHO2_02_FULL_33_16]|uniref:PDZ domain-containing protein n=1 Tax=Candidatus Staskawiczbacteria bacterium RIFCSPHIGHO2_02_FULL_33_16 TaxID=1802204 RepID=A0A1G2HWR8_9BACT|nr:MAG: hypothetical protein A3D34_01995 [Candidatus Staskawiczbacteria bacterium RIFCSPHIGHO2_02_FULL_33_16]
MYDLPKFTIKDFTKKVLQNQFLHGVILLIIITTAVGFASGQVSFEKIKSQFIYFFEKIDSDLSPQTEIQIKIEDKYISKIGYEQAIIDSVREAAPSVVSIVISKNLPVYEQKFINPFEGVPGFDSPFEFQIPQYIQKGTELKEVGAGSGFIVSENGLVLTNKHVVLDKEAEYTVLTNDGKKYSAKVLALNPVQDVAIMKIESDEVFSAIKIGDSSGIQIGQGVIAIGNALGKFSNTVSVGVVSGLGRTISASNQTGNFSEKLEGIIQTDAAINLGNSGGPLINLRGEVIGVNTATAEGAQAIGFAIPINIAKRDIDQIIKTNKISYPLLGVRYVLVDDLVKKKYNLSIDYGALILKGEKGEPAIIKDSGAAKAGLKEKDVILEINQEKITNSNSVATIIAKYIPQDKVVLRILRGSEELNIEVILGERS